MSLPAEHAGPHASRSLWRNVSFLLMWSSVAASGFGDRLVMLVAEPMLGVRAEQPQEMELEALMENGAAVGVAGITAGILFFFFAPYLVLTVVGGWLADRLPRKWIMWGCDETRALILLGAFVMTAQLAGGGEIPPEGIGAAHHWKVYLVIALAGACAAVFNPAKQSAMPQIVAPHHLQQANAVLAGIAMIASLVGMVGGAWLIDGIHLKVGGWKFAWDNGSVRMGLLAGVLAYGISGWFFPFLRVRGHAAAEGARSSGLFRQLGEGLTYIRRHGAVRELVVLNILYWSAVWFLNAGVAVLVKNYAGLQAAEFVSNKAMMFGCLGAGLLAAAVFVMWMRSQRESDVVAGAALALAAAAMLLLTVNPYYGVALALMGVIGFFGGVFYICVDTLTQALTPNHIRGRVFGVRALLDTVSAVVINLVIWLEGEVADRVMVPLLAATAAAMLLVALRALYRQLTAGPVPGRLANVLWHLCRLYALVWHKLEVTGKHHVPRQGPVLLAANHTTAIDPLVIQAGLPRVVRWVMLTRFQFRALNFIWRTIRPIGLGQETGDTAKLRQIIQALQEGEVVGLFPEGRLQREHRELAPFQGGVGLLARRGGAVIVPVWISGTPRARHMFRHFATPSRTRVIFGEPYRPDPALSNEEVADDLRRRMLDLRDQLERSGDLTQHPTSNAQPSTSS